MSLTLDRRHRTNPARGNPSPVRDGGGITGQRAGAVTDAHGASCAVWPRPLPRSPPEKPRLLENGETTFGAVDRGPVSQSEQQETRGDLTCRLPAPPLENSLGQVPM